MYLKIGLPLKELQRKDNLKTFAQIIAAVYLHIILFTLLYLQCMKNI